MNPILPLHELPAHRIAFYAVLVSENRDTQNFADLQKAEQALADCLRVANTANENFINRYLAMSFKHCALARRPWSDEALPVRA